MAENLILDVVAPYWIKAIKKGGRKERSIYVRHTVPVEIMAADAPDMAPALVYEHCGFQTGSIETRLKTQRPIGHDGSLYRPVYTPRNMPFGKITVDAFVQLASQPIAFEWFDSPFGKTLNPFKYQLSTLPDIDDALIGLKEINVDYSDMSIGQVTRTATKLLVTEGHVYTKINEPMWRVQRPYADTVTVDLTERRMGYEALSGVYFRADDRDGAMAFAERLRAERQSAVPIRCRGAIKENAGYAWKASDKTETLLGGLLCLSQILKELGRNRDGGFCKDDVEAANALREYVRDVRIALSEGKPDAAERAVGALQDARESFKSSELNRRIAFGVSDVILLAAKDWDLTSIATPSEDDAMFENLAF